MNCVTPPDPRVRHGTAHTVGQRLDDRKPEADATGDGLLEGQRMDVALEYPLLQLPGHPGPSSSTTHR